MGSSRNVVKGHNDRDQTFDFRLDRFSCHSTCHTNKQMDGYDVRLSIRACQKRQCQVWQLIRDNQHSANMTGVLGIERARMVNENQLQIIIAFKSVWGYQYNCSVQQDSY